MDIIYSPTFARGYKKLSKEVALAAEKKEKIFRNNPFDSRLRTHKLHGELKEFWSFSINEDYRVIFEFTSRQIVWFHFVGKHDIYK